MKWLLVDKNDNINSTCELHSGYGEKGAKMYFMGRKQLEDEKEFDKLWKVMSEQTYDAFQRSHRLHQIQIVNGGKIKITILT